MDSVLILRTAISVTNVDEVAELLQKKSSITVAVCNANSLVRAYRDQKLQTKLNSFTVKAPDGFPVAKASKILYKNKQKRVDGFNIFHKTIEKGLNNNLSHYFYGNNEEITKKLIENLKVSYPKINIAGYYCPPYEDYKVLGEKKYIGDMINKNPDIVWVSLGYPKQEEFIYLIKENKELLSNLVGIGGVFEWVAGTKAKAPELLANMGLEWVLRLIQEPTRLYKRYFVDNLLFIIYFIKQLFQKKKSNLGQ
tara:strand:+ start:22536 stop:23291 length:756 start_codon:yes stop_codon:yes gene_type:complete